MYCLSLTAQEEREHEVEERVVAAWWSYFPTTGHGALPLNWTPPPEEGCFCCCCCWSSSGWMIIRHLLTKLCLNKLLIVEDILQSSSGDGWRVKQKLCVYTVAPKLGPPHNLLPRTILGCMAVEPVADRKFICKTTNYAMDMRNFQTIIIYTVVQRHGKSSILYFG